MTARSRNKFGSSDDLHNEASVEQFFVNRLLSDLGYADSAIKPKMSMRDLSVSRGRSRERWRPDYGVEVNGSLRWIVEAKGVDESLDEWVGQAASYCFEFNRTARPGDSIVEFFLLTNGVTTRLYRWDSDVPLVEAHWHDFADANLTYASLRELISREALEVEREIALPDGAGRFLFKRLPVSELNAQFAWVHRTIYRRESLSYTAAFMEFVKVVFLKLWSDRRALHSPGAVRLPDGTLSVPLEDVFFSRRWIESREAEAPNPLDAILFKQRIDEFEREIVQHKKRRIFDKDERINLSAETLKAITGRLENVDLHSMDEDLNGRMFETFLNSTLRGKDLGQYFTPRSVVKLATGLANLRVSHNHIDRVLDACCGTGGFLIEALADMWNTIDSNPAYSDVDREELKHRVANEAVVGVDIARDPALARIARINMYLHGDGGSRIFQLDALDKQVRVLENDDLELQQEKEQFRQLVDSGQVLNRDTDRRPGIADVVLTNPPFAKEYNRKQPSDNELLDAYELGFNTDGGRQSPITSVSSMNLFFERYYGLLADGGRLISVVDDGILGGPSHSRLRQWMRDKWIIEGVISLPGDAFQRSQARVKTSILVMRKKIRASEIQPSVFMYYCSAVGIDDSPRQRVLPIDALNRDHANEEIATVTALFRRFLDGTLDDIQWTVPAEAIAERMDVKAVMPQLEEREIGWITAGFKPVGVGDLIENVLASDDAPRRVFNVDATDLAEVTYLRVRYDGFCEAGDTVSVTDLPKGNYTLVRAGDLVVSHINAIHGAISIVPDELDGLVVTNEFTVARAISDVHPYVVWAMLRSAEARADMLLRSTGIGRTRVNWAIIKQLSVPMPPEDVASRILSALLSADESERLATAQRAQARAAVANELRLATPLAETIISAFKPPR